MKKIQEALNLLFTNFKLFSQIVLTVWLPGSILLVLLRFYVFPEMFEGEELRAIATELRISNLIEAAFKPRPV